MALPNWREFDRTELLTARQHRDHRHRTEFAAARKSASTNEYASRRRAGAGDGKLPERHLLLATILQGCVAVFDVFATEGFVGLRQPGRRLRLAGSAGAYPDEQAPELTGICRGVDADGSLLLGNRRRPAQHSRWRRQSAAAVMAPCSASIAATAVSNGDWPPVTAGWRAARRAHDAVATPGLARSSSARSRADRQCRRRAGLGLSFMGRWQE